MFRTFHPFVMAAFLAIGLALSPALISPASAQATMQEVQDMQSAWNCVAELAGAASFGPTAILAAMAMPACVETLAAGGMQGYALVECVLQYPPEVCLGLE